VRNGNAAPILFIESNTNNNALGDHTDSEVGLMDSGYSPGVTPGNHYVKVDAATFLGMSLTTLETFSAILVPSDHGGSLTESDLAALDSRSSDILAYVNAGGGLDAFAEDGSHTGGSGAPLFGFLPFLVTSGVHEEVESGNTLTPAGLALGLVNSDINGNASHNDFTSTGGMTVVDLDAGGEILSLDFTGTITPTGVTSEPESLAAISVGLVALFRLRRRLT
jgi:hypothetical protein